MTNQPSLIQRASQVESDGSASKIPLKTLLWASTGIIQRSEGVVLKFELHVQLNRKGKTFIRVAYGMAVRNFVYRVLQNTQAHLTQIGEGVKQNHFKFHCSVFAQL